MSVLIKGMIMPSCCDGCTFSAWSNLHQTASCKLHDYDPCFSDHSMEYTDKRADFCPLIEIPESHGDLIDRDALIAQLESDAEQMEEPIAKMFTYAAINDLKHAQIILEAEGSENHEQIQDDH